MAENNKDKKPFSFVGVATEGMDMKEEQKRMLERKGKTISSFNIQEQEKDIVQRETQTSISHTENLTPSLDEFIPIGSDTIKSNEGTKIEKTKSNKKKEKLEKGTKKHLSEVRVGLFLSEEDMRMLRIYLFSLEPKESLTSFVNSLVKSKIKLIKKEFTEQNIMTLLGLESKE